MILDGIIRLNGIQIEFFFLYVYIESDLRGEESFVQVKCEVAEPCLRRAWEGLFFRYLTIVHMRLKQLKILPPVVNYHSGVFFRYLWAIDIQ